MASEVKKKKKFFNNYTIESIKDFSLALPALILLGTFTYYPLIYSLYLSFTDWDLLRPVKNIVGFENYMRLFRSEDFYESLTVTGLYTVMDVVITLSLGIVLAIVLSRVTKLFSVLRLIVFMPYYISMVIAAMIFIWIFNANHGILNQALAVFGVDRIEWLTNTGTALFAVVVVSVWKGAGYAMMIFLAGLKGIPEVYYEAASIDGANGWHKFRYITLPLIAPITLFLLITSVISSMKVFQSIDIMTGGGPLGSTNVIVYWIYTMAFRDFQIGRASALVIIFFIILVLVTWIQMKASEKRVHYEG